MNKTFYLKELSINDGKDVFEMLQKLAQDENGFENSFKGILFKNFSEKLKEKVRESQGINLKDDRVPQKFIGYM